MKSVRTESISCLESPRGVEAEHQPRQLDFSRIRMKVNGLRSSWQQLSPAWRAALTTWLVARILVSVWAAIMYSLGPVQPPFVGDPVYETVHQAFPHEDQLAELTWGIWYRWDASWYIKIVMAGYAVDDNSVAFPPLYPLLIRLLGKLLLGEYLLAGLIISNVAFVAALWLLYELVAVDLPATTARGALLFLVVFPSAFYFLAPYAESLFFWLTGWILLLPMAYEALRHANWYPQHAWRGLLAAGAGPFAILAYMAYLHLSGLPSFAQAYYLESATQVAPPWGSVLRATSKSFSDPGWLR
jgi:hypothetical protein